MPSAYCALPTRRLGRAPSVASSIQSKRSVTVVVASETHTALRSTAQGCQQSTVARPARPHRELEAGGDHRRRILEAAAACFTENGNNGTSLADIASRALVSHETVKSKAVSANSSSEPSSKLSSAPKAPTLSPQAIPPASGPLRVTSRLCCRAGGGWTIRALALGRSPQHQLAEP
ncbi:MAG: TetR family transcriptional regulator [Mycetocola sp.]